MLELAGLAIRNIRKQKKRTFLTMLGIFVGIAAVVALISLGQGLQRTIKAQFEAVGADKILVQAKEIGFGGQNAPGQLKRHDIDVIRNARGTGIVAGMLFGSARAVYNNMQRTQFLISVPKTAREAELINRINSWKAAEGRLLGHRDSGKAVIGSDLASKKLFMRNIRLGDRIEANGAVFEIVGVLQRIGDPGSDRSVIVSEDDARSILREPEAYSYIIAQAAKGESPDAVAENIEKVMRRDRHLDEGKEDFVVQTSTELIESFTKVLLIIQAVFVGIAAISLLVGGIGIMNTMYTSVLERTREIGIMKAIGAKNRDVLAIFVFESGLLGIAGGSVGILIGVCISKAVEIGINANFGPNTISAAFPLPMILGVLLFSFLVGTISGVLPAHRAARLKPVEALRYE